MIFYCILFVLKKYFGLVLSRSKIRHGSVLVRKQVSKQWSVVLAAVKRSGFVTVTIDGTDLDTARLEVVMASQPQVLAAVFARISTLRLCSRAIGRIVDDGKVDLVDGIGSHDDRWRGGGSGGDNGCVSSVLGIVPEVGQI